MLGCFFPQKMKTLFWAFLRKILYWFKTDRPKNGNAVPSPDSERHVPTKALPMTDEIVRAVRHKYDCIDQRPETFILKTHFCFVISVR